MSGGADDDRGSGDAMNITGLSGDAEGRPTADAILARLSELRAGDAPTHGGHVLSYVYDSGLAELDALAGAAIAAMQPVNGLDPTTFGSVAVLEREVIDFMRELLGGGSTVEAAADQGDGGVVGSVTTGGTESCLLAVKAARDLWRAGGGTGTPRLVAPVTVHAAFQKAAHYFGLELDLVPVDPATGSCEPSAIIERLGADVALVVVSAPSYPFAALDPIEQVAAAAADVGISCHVDACIGGLALPFLPDLPPWDFRVPGVTSISADLHKYGYAPKGVSVLLHRGRSRLAAQYFATTRWPGYPVVNPTMLGSRSAGPLAAAWAILHRLGRDGLARLADDTMASTRELLAVVERIVGLQVVGSPVGPLFAVASDPRADQGRQVDPHHWADELQGAGLARAAPALAPAGGRVTAAHHPPHGHAGHLAHPARALSGDGPRGRSGARHPRRRSDGRHGRSRWRSLGGRRRPAARTDGSADRADRRAAGRDVGGAAHRAAGQAGQPCATRGHSGRAGSVVDDVGGGPALKDALRFGAEGRDEQLHRRPLGMVGSHEHADVPLGDDPDQGPQLDRRREDGREARQDGHAMTRGHERFGDARIAEALDDPRRLLRDPLQLDEHLLEGEIERYSDPGLPDQIGRGHVGVSRQWVAEGERDVERLDHQLDDRESTLAPGAGAVRRMGENEVVVVRERGEARAGSGRDRLLSGSAPALPRRRR